MVARSKEKRDLWLHLVSWKVTVNSLLLALASHLHGLWGAPGPDQLFRNGIHAF